MKKQIKKLTLKKETLRDLMAQNAREVKGGAKVSNYYMCKTEFCTLKKNCTGP